MKSPLILFLLICIPVFIHAQQIEVTVGPVMDPKQIRNEIGMSGIALVAPFRSFSYTSTLFFNPLKNRSYMGFGWKDKSFQFAVLENYLTYNGVKKLTSETLTEKVRLEAFMMVKGKLYVIFSQQFKERDELSVYVNEVSEDMVVLGTPIRVHTFKDLKESGTGLIVSSSEQKEFILITRVHDTKPKEKQTIECKVLDPSFSEIWYKLIETENMDKELALRSIAIDKTGNMYMLVEKHIKKVNQPVVYSYFWNTKSLKTSNLGMSTGDNFGTRLELLNGEKAYIVGLNKNEKTVSYFMNRINPQTQEPENVETGPMPEDFYEASQVRMFDTFDWSVKDIVTLADNSVVASIEAVLVVPKYNQHHTYNTYVVSFTETGTHKWSGVVQKKQVVMAGMDGHMLVAAGNNVLVIYNDHEENISKKTDDTKVEIFKSKDAMIVVQEFDPTGKAAKYPFSKDKDLNGYALFFNSTAKIEKGFYYSPCINIKGMMSVDTRNITFRIK